VNVRSSIPLVRVFGIPIRLDPSWFVTFGFVIILLGLWVYPEWLPDSGATARWLLAVVSGLLFFASLLLHELAHSLVARAYGIPVKSITLFIFGGVAQITKEAERPFAEFVMAFAGPATSVLLSGLFLLLWWAVGSSSEQPVPVMIEWLMVMNLGVAVFNLAPGFPLDGGRVLRSVLWGATGDFRRATFLATWSGRLIAYLLILAGVVAIVGHLAWLTPLSGLWFVFLGFFLESAARRSWQQLKVLEFLRSQKAGDVMSRSFSTVPGWLTLEDLARGHAGSLPGMCLLVTENERVTGLLNHEQLLAVPRARWASVTAGGAMKPSSEVRVVDPETDLATVLQTMEGENIRHTPVVEDGRLVGLLSRDAIVRLLVAQRVIH
jgi:Zn-dependent protease/CBS domain-containing protein